MVKRTGKKMLMVLLMVSLCLSGFLTVGTITAWADGEVTVLKKFYTGNDLTDAENGYKPITVGTTEFTTPMEFNYDATNIGKEGKLMHARINVGSFNRATWGYRWAGMGSYLYDSNITTHADKKTSINLLAQKNSAYLAFDIMLTNTNPTHFVDIDKYYIALGEALWSSAKKLDTEFACIPLKDYYTQTDVGTYKTIFIPISVFDTHQDRHFQAAYTSALWSPDNNVLAYDKICSFAVFTIQGDPNRAKDQYNDLYLDNINILSGAPKTFDTSFSINEQPTSVMVKGDINVKSNISCYQGTWIVAHYNALDELIEVKAIETVNAANAGIIKETTVACEATDKIRVFLWDNMENIRPLTNCAKLPN